MQIAHLFRGVLFFPIAFANRVKTLLAKQEKKVVLIEMEFLMAIVGVLLLCLSATFVVERFIIDWSSYRTKIESEMSRIFNAEVLVNGGVSGTILGSSVSANDITIREEIKNKDGTSYYNNYTIETLKISSSTFNMIVGSFVVKEVEMIRPVFNVVSLYNSYNSRHDSQQKEDESGGFVGLGLKIKAGSLYVGDAKSRFSKKFNNVTGKFFFPSLDKLLVDVHFDIAGVKNHLFTQIKPSGEKLSLEAYVKSNDGNITVKGNMDHDDNVVSGFDGSLEASGKDLSLFINSVTEMSNVTVFDFITSKEEYNLSGDVYYKNGLLVIDKFFVKSDSLDIQSRIKSELKKGMYFDVYFNAKKMDLDRMMSGGGGADFARITKTNVIKNFDFLIYDKLSLVLNVSAENIIYKGSSIDNVLIGGDIVGGVVSIRDFKMDLPGESKFTFSGIVVDNGFRPKLDGEIDISGKNIEKAAKLFNLGDIDRDYLGDGGYSFNSKLEITSLILNLSDMRFSVGNEVIGGDLKYRWHSKGNIIVSNIYIDNINLDDLSIKHTSITDRLLSFEWLRNSTMEFRGQVMFRNVIFQGNSVKNSSFLIEVYDEKFLIKKMDIESSGIHLAGSVEVMMGSNYLRPAVNIELLSNDININNSSVSSVLKRSDKRTSGRKDLWSEEKLNLEFFNRFNGVVSVNFKSLNINGNSIQDLKMDLSFSNRNLNLKSLEAKVYGGSFNMVAKANTQAGMNISAAYALNKIQAGDISKNLFGVNDVSGGEFSLNGKFKTIGYSTLDLVKNMFGDADFVARGVNVGNFDIDYLADNAMDAKDESTLISISEHSAYYGSTLFKEVKGSASIKKGISSMRLSLATKRTTGSMSVNLLLSNFIVNGAVRFLFIPPTKPGYVKEIVAVDMGVKGAAQYPSRDFNNKQLRDLVFSGINPYKAAKQSQNNNSMNNNPMNNNSMNNDLMY